MTVVIVPGATGTNGANLLYRNLLREGTLSAALESPTNQVENAIDGNTFDYWTQTAPNGALYVDLGSPKTCDGLGVSAHDIGTSGAGIALYHSSDGISYTLALSTSPSDNSTIFALFPSITARYWAVAVTTSTANIGAIILGERLKFKSGVLSGHISMHNSKRSKMLNSTTQSGHLRGNRIIRYGIEGSVDFGLVDTSFGDGDFQAFKDHYNSGDVFFYAGSPAKWPKDIALCWRPEAASDITPSYQEGGLLMDLSMEVSAFVDT